MKEQKKMSTMYITKIVYKFWKNRKSWKRKLTNNMRGRCKANPSDIKIKNRQQLLFSIVVTIERGGCYNFVCLILVPSVIILVRTTRIDALFEVIRTSLLPNL